MTCASHLTLNTPVNVFTASLAALDNLGDQIKEPLLEILAIYEKCGKLRSVVRVSFPRQECHCHTFILIYYMCLY